MSCPVCGLPLRPDYGEAVEPVTGRAQVYTAHAGGCAEQLWAVLAELGDAATPTTPPTAAPTIDPRR